MVLAAALVVATLPRPAHADAQAAALAYFRNLEQADFDTSRKATAIARPVDLVHGVYRLEDRASGTFLALITGRGDLRGDSAGWSRIGKDGVIPLDAADMARLRAEVMQSVAWDQLVRVSYGDGGGRRLILVSAVDCPYCARMEASLATMASDLRTTFYVLPTALSGDSNWGKAAALWCATNNGAAWQRYWADRTVPGTAPSTTTCTLDAAAAQRKARDFVTVMASIGARVKGTPGLIREDGLGFGVPAGFDAGYARGTYGPEGLKAFDPAPRDAGSFSFLVP